MKLLKKWIKDQLMRLILSELLVMTLVSTTVCLVMYSYFGHADATCIHPPIYLPVGLAVMVIAIFKKEILSTINVSLFRVMFAGAYGVLFFCFLWLFGTLKFLYLLTGGILLFSLSTYVGIRFQDKINPRKIYLLCFIIILCGMIGEFVYLVLALDPLNIILASSLGICGGLLNLVDFSEIAKFRQISAEDKNGKSIEKQMAQIIFANFCSCMIAADASRFAAKIFLSTDFRTTINTKQ